MKKTNDADMLAAIVRASNRYAMRPALVIDDRTYTYQELFGLAGSICETLRNLLTSSLRTPKFFVKEFSYFLMPCHQHGLRINLLVQR